MGDIEELHLKWSGQRQQAAVHGRAEEEEDGVGP